jgi:uncharacterized protein YwqG
MDLPAKLLPYRDAILNIAKPAATFEALPPSSVLDPKASKLGGVPFTPLYTDWPSTMIHEGLVSHKRPQAFVGQFNFAEIVAAVPELKGVVPDKGLLQLFYDLEECPWGTYPQDHNFIGTYWYPDIDDLRHVPMEVPVASYPEREFGLKFSYRPSFPESSYLPEDFDLPEELEEVYDEALVYDKHHQIGGYPLPVQDDPLDELPTDPSDEAPWQLLLQIDSDEKMKIMWGDTGTIYLGVKTNDLATADLSQAHLILQCC